MSPKRLVMALGLGVLLLYVAYGMLMVQAHWALVYPFHDQRVPRIEGFSPQDVTGPNGPVTSWVHEGPEGAPVVIYFMGNVGNLQAFAPMVQHHATQGRSVVAMGYRGGAGLPGQPSERALKGDALAVIDGLDGLIPGHGPVVVHGYSLGTGIAVHVAAERDLAGLILAAPYARMCELMVARSGLPACQIPGVEKWQSLRDAPRVDEPVLVLHGELDNLIPLDQGARLAAAIPRARLAPVPLGGHDDMFGKAPYLEEIDGFIDMLAR